MTLASYYVGIGHNLQAEHCLQASSYVAALFQQAGPTAGFDEDSLREVVAQVDKKRADAYLSVLNFCAETVAYRQAGIERGDSSYGNASVKDLVIDYSDVLHGFPKPSDFMSKSPSEIESCLSYDYAKTVFLAANSCLGRALRYYVIDGFVSDHVDLCMKRADAFARLSLLEGDEKRKQAMHLKRVQAIGEISRSSYIGMCSLTRQPPTEPIIESGGINEEAYSGLIKTVLHEVGAAYLDMHDLKTARIEGKIHRDPSYRMKAVEAKKMNSFAFTSVRYFTHFIKLYFEKEKLPKAFAIGEEATHDLLMVPASGLSVDVDEVLGFLGSHFKIARLLSKIQQDWEGEDMGKKRMVASLDRSCKRFEYVVKLAKQMRSKGPEWEKKLDEGFAQQVELAKEMAKLLPVKIFRVISGQTFIGGA